MCYTDIEIGKNKLVFIPDIEAITEEIEFINELLDRNYYSTFEKLIEYHLCNGMEFINPEDIGALTDAPIIGYDYKVYWLKDYCTVNEVTELLKGNTVSFEYACNYSYDENSNSYIFFD